MQVGGRHERAEDEDLPVPDAPAPSRARMESALSVSALTVHVPSRRISQRMLRLRRTGAATVPNSLTGPGGARTRYDGSKTFHELTLFQPSAPTVHRHAAASAEREAGHVRADEHADELRRRRATGRGARWT